MIHYADGFTNDDPVKELTDVLLLKGAIPRYDAAGNLKATGRTFKFEYEDEILLAKKRDDVYEELKKCPKMQQYFLEQLKSGKIEAVDYEKAEDDEFANMTEDEFEKSLNEETSGSEAEEIETEWGDI